MYDTNWLVARLRELEARHERMGSDRMPVVKIHYGDRRFDRGSLPRPHDLEYSAPHGQSASRRYPLPGPNGLHEWLYDDEGYSLFHLDEADPTEGFVDHLVKDTKAPWGTLIGGVLGLVGGPLGVAAGATLGTILGAHFGDPIEVYDLNSVT